MKKVPKLLLGMGVLIAVGITAYVMINADDKKSSNSDMQVESKMSSADTVSKGNSQVKRTPRGTITAADMKKQPSLSATMIAQYAVDNISDSSWEKVNDVISKKAPLMLWVVMNDKGTAYHYNQVENSPYYRLGGNDGDQVVFYTANDKKITEIQLAKLVSAVNAKHTNQEINTLKKNVSIKVAEPEKNVDSGFDKLAKEYVWQSGSGSGGYAVLNVETDGSFSGETDSYVQAERFKSSFKGVFSDLMKVDDLVYEATIQDLSYRPKETIKSDTWTIHYDKPTVISDGKKVRIYLKGYQGSVAPDPSTEFMDPSLQLADGPIKSDLFVIDGRGWREMTKYSEHT